MLKVHPLSTFYEKKGRIISNSDETQFSWCFVVVIVQTVFKIVMGQTNTNMHVNFLFYNVLFESIAVAWQENDTKSYSTWN